MIASLLLMSAAAQPAAPQPPAPQPVSTIDEPVQNGSHDFNSGFREDIVVTASIGDSQDTQTSPASATVMDGEEIGAIDLPHTADLLRLVPGVAVSVSGPAGSQTQLRIRGAEANHTLLFVDGIRFNDPASGNEARFELLDSDLFQHIEVVRGPQSALWGADALGGVVAASTDPAREGRFLSATAEYGSLESVRASARGSASTNNAGFSVAGSYLSSEGVDSFGAGGERDGFDNKSLSANFRLSPVHGVGLGLVAHYVEGSSEFDGFDPITFARADTLDATDNRIAVIGASAGADLGDVNLDAGLSYLDSANRNRLGRDPLNSTYGDRTTAHARVRYRFGRHGLTAMAEYQAEGFAARDTQYLGGTDQERARNTLAFVGQWEADWTDWLHSDLAIRHDDFSDFADATTVRASVLVRPARNWSVHAAYGQGIAQPTFYDLYGFFPGSFAGNASLTPETSEGWELGVRYQGKGLSAGITYFDQNLTDEIVDILDPVTFVSSTANARGKSRRRGVEAELNARLARWANLRFSYTYLDADEQRAPGDALLREVRRPRHSGSIAAYGTSGRMSWSATAAYVGARGDTNFDVFPAAPVRLDPYVLASARIGYRLGGGLEAFARVENGFDERYQDVFGYATAGRTVYAGIRLALGR
jgi:vitamin B12 transporter